MSSELKQLAGRLDLRAKEWMEPIKDKPLDQQIKYPNYAIAETMSDIARQIRAVLVEGE